MAVALLAFGGWVAWEAWPKWRTATIYRADVEGSQVRLHTDGCGYDDIKADLDESDSTITVTVEVRGEPRDLDCTGRERGDITVDLAEPLGDRALVDGSDGAELPCPPPEANATRQCERTSPP
jgi:hypothetical protein